MANNKKKSYKVNVYLGKQLYEELETMSKFLGTSVPIVVKILLNTGIEFSKMFDQKDIVKGQSKGGNINDNDRPNN